MVARRHIEGKKILLRSLTQEDISERYLSWLNDESVNQYLETRWEEQSLNKISDFVQMQNASLDSYLFAIIENSGGKHIGNIKIGSIHPRYKYADISYIIGEKTFWGQGIATEAIRLITDYAFSELNLHRCQAGVFAENIGSCRALERSGYRHEGTLKKKLLNARGQWEDHVLYGVLAEEWTL